MAEKYENLYIIKDYSFPGNCPVMIQVGALVKDHIGNRLVALLNFKNQSSKTISSMNIDVVAYNKHKKRLGSPIKYSYHNVTCSPYETFGKKEAIVIPDPSTALIEIIISNIAYSDGSTWQYDADAVGQNSDPKFVTSDFANVNRGNVTSTGAAVMLLIVSIMSIIVGCIMLGLDVGGTKGYTSFGGDFYTYSYDATRLAASNVRDLAIITKLGFSFGFIITGLILLAVYLRMISTDSGRKR